MSGLTRDGTAEPVFLANQILRRERGQGKNSFHCSADLEQIDSHNTRLTHTLLKVLNMHTYMYNAISRRIFVPESP